MTLLPFILTCFECPQLAQSIADKKRQLAELMIVLEELHRDYATQTRDLDMTKADVSSLAAGRETSQLQVLSCSLNGEILRYDVQWVFEESAILESQMQVKMMQGEIEQLQMQLRHCKDRHAEYKLALKNGEREFQKVCKAIADEEALLSKMQVIHAHSYEARGWL